LTGGNIPTTAMHTSKAQPTGRSTFLKVNFQM